jgi:hypothetical protein
VGASLVGFDPCKPSLKPRSDGSEFNDAYIPSWSVVVGPDGRRILDETAPYGQVFGVAWPAGDEVYGIFDHTVLVDNNTERLQTFKLEFPPGRPLPPQIWTSESIGRMIESGGIVTADSLRELAALIPTAALGATIERYNRFVDEGVDRDFGKATKFMRKFVSSPFDAAPLVPASVGITAYGVEIDSDAHVMTATGHEVPGLFAAGECTGGVIGGRYVGSGYGIVRPSSSAG